MRSAAVTVAAGAALAVALLATPTVARGAQQQLVLLRFAGKGLADELLDSATERAVTAALRVSAGRFKVVTRDMLAAIVGEEKLLRCEETARCELDLGVGLGTGYMLAGSIRRLGVGVELAVKLYDVRRLDLLAHETEAAGREVDLIGHVGPLVERVIRTGFALGGGAAAGAAPAARAIEDEQVAIHAPRAVRSDGGSGAAAPSPMQRGEAGGAHAVPLHEPDVALRLAVAPGFGSAARAMPMEDAVALQFPLQLDLGWRFGPFTVGAYGSWALARAPRCPEGASCSASAVRLGVQGTWAFEPSAGMQGWVGAGTGWERATFHVKRGGTDDATSYSGLELLQIQGGLEWRLHRRLALGPYLQLGLGRYSGVRVETKVESASAAISDRTVHAWLYAGVRARVGLGGPW